MIRIEDLAKNFDGFWAVDGVTFKVAEGEIFGFLGPNGAGKTTTIKMLCTLLRPSRGHAWVSGFDVLKQPNEVRKSIGVIFQDPSLVDQLTARENLKFHAIIYKVSKKELGDRYRVVVHRDSTGLHFEMDNGEEFIPQLVKNTQVPITAVNVRHPTLDDVFLELTGREIRSETSSDKDRLRGHMRFRKGMR